MLTVNEWSWKSCGKQKCFGEEADFKSKSGSYSLRLNFSRELKNKEDPGLRSKGERARRKKHACGGPEAWSTFSEYRKEFPKMMLGKWACWRIWILIYHCNYKVLFYFLEQSINYRMKKKHPAEKNLIN